MNIKSELSPTLNRLRSGQRRTRLLVGFGTNLKTLRQRVGFKESGDGAGRRAMIKQGSLPEADTRGAPLEIRATVPGEPIPLRDKREKQRRTPPCGVLQRTASKDRRLPSGCRATLQRKKLNSKCYAQAGDTFARYKSKIKPEVIIHIIELHQSSFL